MQAPTQPLVFPPYYIELVESLIRARQGDVGQVARCCGLAPGETATDTTLTLAQFQALMRLAQQNLLPGEPPLLQLMRHLPVTAHGLVGMVAMTADTLSEALDVALRYLPLLLPAFEMHRRQVGNESHVVIRRLHDFGAPLNARLVELVAGSLCRMGEFASPAQLSPRSPPFSFKVFFAHACEGDPAAYAAFFNQPVTFNAPEDRIVIARAVLAQPLLTRNRTTHQVLEAALERQRQSLAQPAPVTQRVRRQLTLALAAGQLPGAEAIAAELGVSVRTLSRRLREEGTSLPALAEALRLERAELLLVGSDLPLARVAEQVGFSDLSTFSRAFKRVKGRAPSELRRPAGSEPD